MSIHSPTTRAGLKKYLAKFSLLRRRRMIMTTADSVVVEVVSSFFDDFFTEVNTVEADGQRSVETPGIASDGPPVGAPPPPMLGPPTSNIFLAFSVVYSSIIVLANITTLYAFAIERRLRTYNNYFLISLAIADLLVGFMLTAGLVNNYYPTVFVCKLHLAFNDAFLTVSVFGVVAICVDRHQATYDPITHFIKKGTRRGVILNTGVWLLSLAFWLPYTVGWDLVVSLTTPSQDDLFKDSCVPRYGLRVITSLLPVALTILFPAVLIAVFYIRIVYKIRHSLGAKKLQTQFQANSSRHQSRGEAELEFQSEENESHDVDQGERAKTAVKQCESSASARKATRTLSFIVVAFVIAWVPHVIFLIVTNLNRDLLFQGKIPEPFLISISLMRYTNSFLNPISYAVAQPLFRQTVFNLFLCKCPK